MKKIFKKISILIIICGILLFSICKYRVNAISQYISEQYYIHSYTSVQVLRASTYIEFRIIDDEKLQGANVYYVRDGLCTINVYKASDYIVRSSGYTYYYSKNIPTSPEYYSGLGYFAWRYNYSDLGIDDINDGLYYITLEVNNLLRIKNENLDATLRYIQDIPSEFFDEVYTHGYDDGYEIGYDEGYEIGENIGYENGYEIGYDEGIEHTEFITTHWFTGMFDAISDFFNIQIGGMTLGGIILIPFSITFVWFILRAFRGGGSEWF